MRLLVTDFDSFDIPVGSTTATSRRAGLRFAVVIVMFVVASRPIMWCTMPVRPSVLKIAGCQPMSHRPEFAGRYWFYIAAAYLLPVVAQVAFPEDPTLSDELVWLITLAPAFLLSLQYGIKGAFVALILGTLLFTVVQVVVAVNFTPDDWRITVPTYVAYGSLSISVGWLSEQLHGYYGMALERERMAAIGQLALTIRHDVNNALTAITNESQLLASDDENLNDDQRESIKAIQKASVRMANDVGRLTKLEGAPAVSPAQGLRMLDLSESSVSGD